MIPNGVDHILPLFLRLDQTSVSQSVEVLGQGGGGNVRYLLPQLPHRLGTIQQSAQKEQTVLVGQLCHQSSNISGLSL